MIFAQLRGMYGTGSSVYGVKRKMKLLETVAESEGIIYIAPALIPSYHGTNTPDLILTSPDVIEGREWGNGDKGGGR